jgi:[acyl-carrier-protein] S-malonyltransferase
MLAKGGVLRHLFKLKQRSVILCTSECNHNFSIACNRKLSTRNEKCINETETQGVSDSEASSTETDIKQLLEEATVCSDPPPDNPENIWSTSPYPEGVLLKRDQSRHFRKPNIDPRETSVILFPGQGTQFVGMGKDLMKFPIARDLFDAANDLLGYDLRELCFNGPKEQLDKTIYCQPAVMVCSLAAVEKLKEERPMAIESCVATAGFSIGEITALVFAGALSFEEGLSCYIFHVYTYVCLVQKCYP